MGTHYWLDVGQDNGYVTDVRCIESPHRGACGKRLEDSPPSLPTFGQHFPESQTPTTTAMECVRALHCFLDECSGDILMVIQAIEDLVVEDSICFLTRPLDEDIE